MVAPEPTAAPRSGGSIAGSEPFDPDPRLGVEPGRHWIKSGGGVLASDSPLLSVEMFEMFRQVRLPELVHGYLVELPLITVHKTTLRRAEHVIQTINEKLAS